ncbi:MAG: tetratricopeptide repeat protein [Chloroflexi bacterium]|nr:tetratricopeptide repeat protein [Chloroflexota bacterium]
MRNQPRYSKGQRIGGYFLVHEALMGGMGEVYLCLDERQDVPVALKTFQGGDPGLADIFEKEVATWIALESHPNIVRCYYMERFDNIPFMALEWIAGVAGKGTDLRSWLKHGALEPALALRFTIDIVRGLQHANTTSPGIVHRDLKPDNVLVSQAHQAKITDFGLATLAYKGKIDIGVNDEIDMQRSRYVANIVGTPAYMAPEQWRGDVEIDFRTDIYAVGCILYELLTGRRPFDGTTVQQLRLQHLAAPVPGLNVGVSSRITGVLKGCLAKERRDRFERLDLMLTELIELYDSVSNSPLPEVTIETLTVIDLNNRGMTYGFLGQHERALMDFDAAIALDSDTAVAYYNRATAYQILGQHERAIEDYNFAIRLTPDDAHSYNNRGACYDFLDQHERAIEDYDAAIGLDPDYPEAHSNRGDLYRKLGQFDQAIQDHNTAISLDSGNPISYFNRGETYSDLNQHERAIADFDVAINLRPNYAIAYAHRGFSYGVLGKHERAIWDLDTAINLDPSYASAYSFRGNQHGHLGRFVLALRDYDTAIRINPNLDIAHLNRGSVLANMGRLHDALPSLETAYALGMRQALGKLQDVRRRLGLAPLSVQPKPDDSLAAANAFSGASSFAMMQHAVRQFPVLANMIPAIEQVIQEQVPPEQRGVFIQKLAWLRQIVG